MDVSSSSELGEALVNASDRNMVDSIRRLLTAGADVNYVTMRTREGKENGATSLTAAAGKGHVEAMRVLIGEGADVNMQVPWEERTSLHVAVEENRLPAIELLLSKGARHDLKSNLGQTPLHEAASYGHVKAATCLLDHGADVNAKDFENVVPLHE